MPLDVIAVLPNPGPEGLPVLFGRHRFAQARDGQLEHHIDGVLRATVPPEAMRDYAKDWPACADLVGEILRPAPAPAPARELGRTDPPL